MDTNLGKKDALQAVALADDFTTSLTPVQDLYPSLLLPVIDVPLFDYLIETLIRSRVEELFLYCSSHVDALKEYAKQKDCKEFTITFIVSDGCRSLGDALRDIDAKGWIRGHFILIRGDAFINADLKGALGAHCARFTKDKGAAMTLLLRNVGSTKDSFLEEETCLIVSDKTNNKMLCYKKLKNGEKKISLELNWFLEHNEIELDSSFIDTHVYLCSPSVLPLFADNFDFQTMEDFIRGVLMNEEILDTRIYWQRLNPEDYGLPVSSWKAYHTLSRDILHRHAFPLAPDAFASLRNFIYARRSTYKHRSATLAKGCILEADCIVGQGSTLGKNTFATRSVIGKNCTIGQGVTIKNSYVLDSVRINDNCVVENSVIFAKCVIAENVRLDGCVLSCGVHARKDYTDCILKPDGDNASVTNMSDVDADVDADGGSGFLFFKDQGITEREDEFDETSSEEAGGTERNSPEPDDTNMFLSEVIDSLLRGFQDKLKCENLILEINSSRYAYNVTIREVTYNVTKAILSLPLHYLSETKSPVNAHSYQKILKTMLSFLQPIVANYVKTEDAQEDCLRGIEDVASSTQEAVPFLQHLLHFLYDRDILSEEKIIEWYETGDEHSDGFQYKAIRDAVSPFVKWLREAEEDSTESDDDDDDDDD